MKIGLLSDTHNTLDERIFNHFSEVDEIWHAGDVGDSKVIEELLQFKPLVGVYGNIDNAMVRSYFPKYQRFTREGVSILMTHIAGKPGRYNKELIQEIKLHGSPQLLVCGHSHILMVKYDKRLGLLWVNPGACGNHGIHKVKTLLRFELSMGTIKNMEIIELGSR